MVRLNKFPVPTEGIRYQAVDCDTLIDEDTLGKGTLFVTESVVSWINSTSGEGFNIQYRKITLHGISRDENLHPLDCVYIMVSGSLENENGEVEPLSHGSDSEESADDDDEKITEVRFIPENKESVDQIYKSILECTLLHPDPTSETDEEEDLEEEDEEGDEGDEDDAMEGNGDGGGAGDGPGGMDEDCDEADDFQDRLRLYTAGNGNNGSNNENPPNYNDADLD